MGTNCTHTHLSLKKLSLAIIINLILTLVQIAAGILSGSLSMIADAVHNLSDALSLVVAYISEKISHWPEDKVMTYGYGRARIVGAFINSLTLIFVSFYILYEVVMRLLNPQPIDGWLVVIVATIAFVIDVVTAKLIHSETHQNINMKAAYLHNLTDALASLAVMASGVLVLLYEFYFFDLMAGLLISGYIFYQSIHLIKSSLRHLMQAIPEDLNYDQIKDSILIHENIENVVHLHLWSMNEKKRSLEAQLKLKDTAKDHKKLLLDLKEKLKSDFNIESSTIELI